MGNISEPSQQFLERYRFIQLVNDYNFGSIKVYRKKQLNFDYIMILDRYVAADSISQLHIQLKSIQYLTYSKSSISKYLKVILFEMLESMMECNLTLVRVYLEYYNYTLNEVIRKKYSLGEQLTIHEIYYILNIAIQTYQLLITINPNLFNANTNSIFITPQGYLKFLPIATRDFYQDQNQFCKTLCYQTQRCTTNFDKNHKKLITEILKFIHELIQLVVGLHPPINKDFMYHHLIKLEKEVKTCKNLIQLKKIIPPSQLKSLTVKKKESQTSQYNPTDTPPSSETNHYKKSMKKWVGK